MNRRYYSSRKDPNNLTIDELYFKIQKLFLLFRDKDYFKEKAGIVRLHYPDTIKHKAAISLSFQLFPITKWELQDITEDHIFDALEFLYDHVSKPVELVRKATVEKEIYVDYDNYDTELGQEEFRNAANVFLADYKTGFELTKEGIILALGKDGLQHILSADIIPYDEVNVDNKVRNAISKWRNRHLSLSEKKEAIRELADVFEWLKKTKGLAEVLDKNDGSDLFNIANNFAIRHHDPKQKNKYDESIWYSWIFHFYLATYHAAIRLLIKKQKEK